MKCEECLNVIEEYSDLELDEPEALSVRAHIAACEACSRQLDMLSAERNLYALYRRDLEVTPALWNGIAARIQATKVEQPVSLGSRLRESFAALFGTPRLSPALTFALVVLAVGATAGLMKYMQPEPQVALNPPVAQKGTETAGAAKERASAADPGEDKSPEAESADEQPAARKNVYGDKPAQVLAVLDRTETRRAAPRPELYMDGESPDQLVREAEQKYMAAITMLARDAKRRRTLLEPDVRARFEQTLTTVDQTIAETRRAARRQPNDPVAVQYMLAAYAKKVEVLKEMATYRADDNDIQ